MPEEVVCANSIHKFKEKYAKWILKEGTIQALLFPVSMQIGKYI